MHYAQQRSSSSNAIGFGLIILLHLGVGYALLQALATQRMDKVPVPVPVEVALIAEQPKVIEPPTATVPIPVDHPRLDSRPEIEFSIKPAESVQEPSGTTSSQDAHDLSKTVTVEPMPVVDTPANHKLGHGIPLGNPFVRRIPEGWVDLQCDVDDTGGMSNCSMIAHEGAMAFVDAALDYVRATRISPATRNGVEVAEKGHRFHIAFKPTDK